MVAREIANIISQIILWIAAVGIAIPRSVLALECAAACLGTPPTVANSEASRPKIAVLVPAPHIPQVKSQFWVFFYPFIFKGLGRFELTFTSTLFLVMERSAREM